MKKLLLLFAIQTALMGCSGGSDGNPFGPDNPPDVSGHWLQYTRITRDTCNLKATDRTFIWGFTIVQDGSYIAWISDGDTTIQQPGTIDLLNGQYTISYRLEEGDYSEVYQENGTFYSNSEYRGTAVETIFDEGRSCEVWYEFTGQRG
jgi:hypothetical protein